MLTHTHPLHVAAADGVSPEVPTATDPMTYESRSTTATFTTAAHYVGDAEKFCCTFTSSSAAADGTVKLQGCNDPARAAGRFGDEALVNWFDVPFVDSTGAGVTSQTVSGTGNITFSEPECTYRWVRLVYTRSSGTAVFTARVQSKGVL